MYIEILGVTATLFVLASFLVKGEKRIRSINIFGAALFVVYGALLPSFSTMLLNAALIFIHIYHLYAKQNIQKNN